MNRIWIVFDLRCFYWTSSTYWYIVCSHPRIVVSESIATVGMHFRQPHPSIQLPLDTSYVAKQTCFCPSERNTSIFAPGGFYHNYSRNMSLRCTGLSLGVSIQDSWPTWTVSVVICKCPLFIFWETRYCQWERATPIRSRTSTTMRSGRQTQHVDLNIATISIGKCAKLYERHRYGYQVKLENKLLQIHIIQVTTLWLCSDSKPLREFNIGM